MSLEAVLERFHRALIDEIQTQRPEYLTGPFTVAEIYQNLVPYGSHRDRIGVEMNADYEDALLRLLAGQGGFLVLESEPALRDIKAELGTSNPNTGLYREFAAVDVRLNQSRLDLSAAAIDEIVGLVEELDAESPVPMNELAPAESAPTGSKHSEPKIVPPGVDTVEVPVPVPAADATGDPDLWGAGAEPGGLQPEFVEPEAPQPTAVVAEGACPWCRAGLPERDSLNFCPFCGTDLKLVPCASCGDELEAGWRFCISCGSEVSG